MMVNEKKLFGYFGISDLLDEEQIEGQVAPDTFVLLKALAGVSMKVDEVNEYGVAIARDANYGKWLITFLSIFIVASQLTLIALVLG